VDRFNFVRTAHSIEVEPFFLLLVSNPKLIKAAALYRIHGSTSTVGWAAAASADDIKTLVAEAEGCAANPESIEK